LLPFLQEVEDEFDTRGHAEFVKNPKKVVSDDSGSTVLGFTVAFIAINFYHSHGAAALAFNVSVLPAGLPLVDAAVAVLRRLRNRGSPCYGDRSHFYDRLLACGWSKRKVAFSCYGITGIFCLAGRLASKTGDAWAFTISVMTVGSFIILEWRLGSLRIPEIDRPVRQTTVWPLPNVFGNFK
jgi:hypothetical protein